MAQKQHGKTPKYELQPDYQFSHNGYGLLQLTANYAIDVGQSGQSSVMFARGSEFLGGSSELSESLSKYKWTCVKAEERGRDGKVAYITVHYAAIKDGDWTETEASLTSAAVSEAIETHPNFTRIQVPGIGDGKNPLGGTWVFNAPPAPDNTAVNKFRAQWGPIQGSQVGAITYNFLGFLPNASDKPANRKAGVKSWMRPSLTLKATVYTSNADEAASVCSYIGFVTDKNAGIVSVPACYNGIGESGLFINTNDVSQIQQGKRDWLIVGANMEVFGGLYKVSVDMLLSGVAGWDQDIYPKLTEQGFVNTTGA